MVNTYVYGLLDPRNKEIFYVGKSNNPAQRSKGKWNKEVRSRIKAIKSSGLRYQIRILEKVTNGHWVATEKYWIKKLKRKGYLLLNQNEGGGGVLAHTKAYRLSLSHRFSGIKKGPFSKKHCRNLSKAHLGIRYGDRKSKCLNRSKVEKIRLLSKEGVSHYLLADKFKVSRQTISDVVHNRSWINV